MQSVLLIASTESRGVAGLAVDLRCCAALGVHGMPVVAGVTAQGTGGNRRHGALSPDDFSAQLEAALEDAPAAIKVGLLPSLALARGLADRVAELRLPLVLDPVGASSDGQSFLPRSQWREAMLTLAEHATLLTPNLPELRALLGDEVEDRDEALVAAARRLPARAVLVKGGHRSIDADDLLITGAEGIRSFAGERFEGEFRGSGCVLSTAIAANLARGRGLEDAIAEAREFLRAAMLDATRLGADRLPHLFWEFYGGEGLP